MKPLITKQMTYLYKIKRAKTNSFCVVALLVLSFSTSPLWGQDTPEEITERFFELFETSHKEAITYIAETKPNLTETEKGKYGEMVTLLDSIVPSAGEYYGYGLLAEKSWGTKLKYMGYMLNYETEPVLLRMYFEKEEKKWNLISILFDSKQFWDDLNQVAPSVPSAQEDAPKAVGMEITEFFKNYDQSANQAIDFFKKRKTGIGHRELLDSETLGAEFEKLRETSGEVEGHEIIKYVIATESLSFASCLVYFQQEIVKFNFWMYKPNKKWFIHSFGFSPDFMENLQKDVKNIPLN